MEKSLSNSQEPGPPYCFPFLFSCSAVRRLFAYRGLSLAQAGTTRIILWIHLTAPDVRETFLIWKIKAGNYGNFEKANILSLSISCVARGRRSVFVVEELEEGFATFFRDVHECDAANEGLSRPKNQSKERGKSKGDKTDYCFMLCFAKAVFGRIALNSSYTFNFT